MFRVCVLFNIVLLWCVSVFILGVWVYCIKKRLCNCIVFLVCCVLVMLGDYLLCDVSNKVVY